MATTTSQTSESAQPERVGRPLRPPRVALVMVAVGDLSASGGAERQFCDVFNHFRRAGSDRVSLITARASLARLSEAGRLHDSRGIIALPLGDAPARGVLNVGWLTVLLLAVTVFRRFEIVHLCLPTPSYVPYAAILSRLPRALRPRLVLNVIDCTLAHTLGGRPPSDLYERQVADAHRLYFRWVALDGVYTWYQAFAELCRAQRLMAQRTIVRAARFCFTDPQRFHPAGKEQVIVFAGRLSAQKRPELFVEASAILRRRAPDLLRGWRFEMYGGGALEDRVRSRIAELGVGDMLSLTKTPDLAPVFARTMVFVSTQAFENFTSLAMLEAMAAGNAIIAEDIGQTREFVRQGANGLLVVEASAKAFADALEEYIRHSERHAGMATESRRLTTDVHTIERFTSDLIEFWHDVLAAS